MLKKFLKFAQKDLYIQAVSVIAILLSITVVAVAYIKTSNNNKKDEPTTPYVSYTYETLPPQAPLSTDSALFAPLDTTLPQDFTQNLQGEQGVQNTPATQSAQTPVPAQTQAQQPPTPTVYSWSKAEIVSRMSAAINKTKGYSGSLQVHQSEAFEANITECTGGSIGKVVANSLVSAVVKPTDQTLSFNGGTATNSDGENVQILLPKTGQFSLSPSGVSSAKAYQEGNHTVMTVTLVRETCGPTDVPPHNSSGIGYLNVASIDLMGMTITKGEIQYLGSTIKIKVNQAGYVTYAEYTIPLHVYGEGQKDSLSGHATFDGKQTEIWELPL
ncbi:MAG: hypothetical protein IKC01_05605 [Clostridia bacterium]|nr:hypothetical protein [Clostridia bacterium]